MKRNCRENREKDSGSDAKRIWMSSRRYLGGNRKAICQTCYEVSEDVIDAFRQNFHQQYWEKLFYRKTNGKYQLLNLWKANELILGKPEFENTFGCDELVHVLQP